MAGYYGVNGEAAIERIETRCGWAASICLKGSVNGEAAIERIETRYEGRKDLGNTRVNGEAAIERIET